LGKKGNGEARGMEIEKKSCAVELLAVALFVNWSVAYGSSSFSQSSNEVPTRQFLLERGAELWFGFYWFVGAIVHREQVSRVDRHVLHHSEQEASDFLALVPSHNGSSVLLAFLRVDVSGGLVLLCDELFCSRDNVLLLLLDGDTEEAEVVQCDVHHFITNQSNDCRCNGDHNCFLLLLEGGRHMSYSKGKQHCGLCHVRVILILVCSVLLNEIQFLSPKKEG